MTPERERLLDTALSEFAVTARVLVVDGVKFYHREPVEKLVQALRAHDAAPQVVGETVEVRAAVMVHCGDVFAVCAVRRVQEQARAALSTGSET